MSQASQPQQDGSLEAVIKASLVDGKLPCAVAFSVAKKFKVAPKRSAMRPMGLILRSRAVSWGASHSRVEWFCERSGSTPSPDSSCQLSLTWQPSPDKTALATQEILSRHLLLTFHLHDQ